MHGKHMSYNHNSTFKLQPQQYIQYLPKTPGSNVIDLRKIFGVFFKVFKSKHSCFFQLRDITLAINRIPASCIREI